MKNYPEIHNITEKFLSTIKLPSPDGKQLRYLFVMPKVAPDHCTSIFLPYGFLLVCAALKISGRDVHTLNLNSIPNPYEKLAQTVADDGIDVVFTGGISVQYAEIRQIMDIVKTTKPQCITCVGGGIISSDPPAAMEALKTADYGITGEGEITINSFAYALENGRDMMDVQGLVLLHFGGGYTTTPPRPPISDLDMLPFPDYEGFGLGELLRTPNTTVFRTSVERCAVVAIGRSCPFDCTFCFHPTGRKYRRRSIDSVFEEMDWLTGTYGSKFFLFCDEQFIYSDEFIKEFTNRIALRNVAYYINAHANALTRENVKMLKNSGCEVIGLGIESACDHILKSMRKRLTIGKIENALDIAYEAGLAVFGFIILGDPEETPESIAVSLNWWKERWKKHHINVEWILTFPGTHLYHQAAEKGIIKDKVQYIRQNKTQINVTSMSDSLYWNMYGKVSLFKVIVSSGTDIRFEEIDNVAAKIRSNFPELTRGRKVAVWPATAQVLSILDIVTPAFIADRNVFLLNKDAKTLRDNLPDERFGNTQSRYDMTGLQVYEPDEIMHSTEIDTILFAHDISIERGVYRNIVKEAEKYHGVHRIITILDMM